MKVPSLKGRDLLRLADLTPSEVASFLDVARAEKAAWAAGERSRPLEGRAVALIFEKPSMRTRVSFELACARLGAHPVVLGADSAFSRSETVHDTTKVLERYCDAIVLRTFEQSKVEEVAHWASVPVINALTDEFHPCQGLADLQTILERFDALEGLVFAYVGDGNNMAHTYLEAAALTGMHLRVATPDGFGPDPAIVDSARRIASGTGATIEILGDPVAAVTGAHVVATDTWASMGQEAEHAARLKAFAGFTVDAALLANAAADRVFLHCLPAHRGEEVLDEVIDAGYSAVFDEAENRLHAQKTLLGLVLGD